MENETKRKTKTSSEVKNRYNKKVYDSVSIKAPKELVQAFRAKCEAEGVSQSRIFKKAMEDFLKS